MNTNQSIDPKGAMGAQKPQLHMIPSIAMEEMAKALLYGAKLKPREDGTFGYGERNWLGSTVKGSTYISAMMRHINKLKDGQDLDEEMECHHLGAVMASCAIYLDARKHGTLVDDRVLPPQSPSCADKDVVTLPPGTCPKCLMTNKVVYLKNKDLVCQHCMQLREDTMGRHVQPSELCPHGVRWPHVHCQECADAARMPVDSHDKAIGG